MKGLLFVYLITYGGAIVALFNPFYGLLAYICFAIIRPDWLWHWVSMPANHSRILAVAMLIGWALQGFGNWRFHRGKAITLAFVAFWFWALVGAIVMADDKEKAFLYLESLAKILLPFLVGMTTIHSVKQLRILIWTIVLSMGYVAYDLNWRYYEGYNWLYHNGYGGIDNNSFAIALVTGVGCSVFLGLASPRWWQKLICVASAAFMMNAIFFSYSRGGMLALIIMGAVAFFLVPKRPIHYVTFALVVALGFRLMGPGATERFLSTFLDKEERDRSAQSRLDMWEDCWDVMQRYPILGVGPENWGEIAPEYGWRRGKYAHSLWLQTGAETGFIGLGLLLTFYGLGVIRNWKLSRRPPPGTDPFLPHVGRMVVASLVGFMVAGQFVSLWGLELPYYINLVGAVALKLAWAPQPAWARQYHPAMYRPRYGPAAMHPAWAPHPGWRRA